MATENYIRGKVDSARHHGLRSYRRELQSSADSLREFVNGDDGEINLPVCRLAQSCERSLRKK